MRSKSFLEKIFSSQNRMGNDAVTIIDFAHKKKTNWEIVGTCEEANKGPNPLISIIMPVYNVKDYLEGAIESVLIQQLADFELIVVDDGSTDECPEIVARYARADSRIRAIRVENGGQGRARNIGMHMAKGSYIYFMDSDDVLVPDALNKMVEPMERFNLDVLYFDADVRIEDGQDHDSHAYARECAYPELCAGEELFKKMQCSGELFIPPYLSMARRDYLSGRGIQFPEGVIHEDEAYTIASMVLATRAGYLPERLYVRRYRPGSTMTALKFDSSFIGYLSVWGYTRDLLIGAGCLEPLKTVKDRFINCAWWALSHTERSLSSAADLADKRSLTREFDELILKRSIFPALYLMAKRFKAKMNMRIKKRTIL